MPFQKGHVYHPRKGTQVVRMAPQDVARFEAMKSGRDDWASGFGTSPRDQWGGTFTHPADITSPVAATDAANPWALRRY